LLKTYTVALSFVLALVFFIPESFAKTKGEVDDSVMLALARFKKDVKGAPEYLKAAKGVLIIPDITKAGFIFGAQHGTGALKIRGKTSGYFTLAGGSLGFQAGAEKYDMVILFMTNEALKKFRDSKVWEAGVDAEVTVVAAGSDATLGTLRSRSPVVGFVFDQKGLLGGMSIKGVKFAKTNPI